MCHSVPLPTLSNVAFSSVAFAVALSIFPSIASADFALSADAAFAFPPAGLRYPEPGADFGLRLGARDSAGSFLWEPEVGFALSFFGADPDFPDTTDLVVYRGTLGLRAAYDLGVRPGLSAHVGLARANAYECTGDFVVPPGSFDGGAVANALRCERQAATSALFDVGTFVDLPLTDVLEAGVHATYSHFVAGADSPALGWFAIGAHLQLLL